MLLSGVFPKVTQTPGIVQAVRLNNLLEKKTEDLSQIENRLQSLTKYHKDLQSKKSVQIQAIREILGYVSSDELVFEFPEEFTREL